VRESSTIISLPLNTECPHSKTHRFHSDMFSQNREYTLNLRSLSNELESFASIFFIVRSDMSVTRSFRLLMIFKTIYIVLKEKQNLL